MKKVGIAIFCVVLCWAVALFFVPESVKSNLKVDSTGCLGTCHIADYPGGQNSLHTFHSGSACNQCHSGAPAKGTVSSSACIECHPVGDAGKCELVLYHEDHTYYNNLVDIAGVNRCLVCHDDCEEEETTTTTTVSPTTTTVQPTTTTSSTQVCPIVQIYGENSVEVAILRYLRDNVLSTTPEGQEIIRLYYELSPVIAMAIQNDEAMKAEVKEAIDGVLDLIVP